MKKRLMGLLFGLVLGAGIMTAASTQAKAATEATATPIPTEGATAKPSATPVAAKTLTSISVADAPLELPYASTITAANISLTLLYSDGTKATAKAEKISTVDTKQLGSHTMTITYQNMTTTYTVSVVPRQVTGLHMKSGTTTTMTVNWDKLEESTRYEIYTSTRKDGTYSMLTTTDKNEYTFKNLSVGQIVYVQIRATAESLTGEYSVATAIAPKPGKVTGVKATKAVKTKITLAWNETKGATGYAIYYRLSTSTAAYVYAGSTTELTYLMTGLSAGKDYQFIVYAYGADLSNLGDGSTVALFGTAPKIPVVTLIKGGDKRVKLYWKYKTGVQSFRIYISTKATSGFTLAGTVLPDHELLFAKEGLKQKKKYYVKVVAVRTVSGMELTSESVVKNATTKKAKATSVVAKYFTSLKKFKKSAAYKKYKAFSKKVSYKKSYVVPGLKVTNVAGFNSTRMVPQSVTFAGDYLLISAYDYAKVQESVIYVLNKSSRKYITTLVLPHKGHVGGMAFDGGNLWLAYGKNLQCIKYNDILSAVTSGRSFTEITKFATVCPMIETVSYVAYYKDRIWVGAYNEKVQKYMYGYTIGNQYGVEPTLTQTNRMLMPNRTQGVAFTSAGKMIVSRSCQTKKGRSGFMSQLETYKPTWNFSSAVIKKNSRKKVVKMPPMNEGIAISGSYTYVIYESSSFAECQAKMDRVTAFKTSKVS